VSCAVKNEVCRGGRGHEKHINPSDTEVHTAAEVRLKTAVTDLHTTEPC
jgi:hypothetical protein